MVSPNEVKQAMILRLKATATLTALLAGSTEIREAQWQGTAFVYPCVRVRVGTMRPVTSNCNMMRGTVAVACFSEQASSDQADQLADVINDALHDKSFSSGVVRLCVYSDGIVPAIRMDERTWRSESLFTITVEPS